MTSSRLFGAKFERNSFFYLILMVLYLDNHDESSLNVEMFDTQDNRLFETNNYSILSKYSAIKSGYFEDPILEEFIEEFLNHKSWRRTSLINRGYAARLYAVDWIVNRSIRFDGLDCVIILGAGYDTLSFRYQSHNVLWIEVDLHQVIETKLKFVMKRWNLSNNDCCFSTEMGIYFVPKLNYAMITCDIRNCSELKKRLSFVISKSKRRAANAAILNEVCLCYINEDEVKAILSSICEMLNDSGVHRVNYIGFEQVKSSSSEAFSRVMEEHFQLLGHPLKYFPDSSKIRKLFLDDLKFAHVTVSSLYQIYHNALLDSSQLIDLNSEPFDEFEEMDLYLSNYALVTGALILKDPFMCRNSLKQTPKSDDQLTREFESMNLDKHCEAINIIQSQDIRRYGQSNCILSSGDFLVSGGFGITRPNRGDGKQLQHRRLGDCLTLTKEKTNLSCLPLDTSDCDMSLDRLHGQVVELSPGCILFAGGRQSPTGKNCNSFLAQIVDGKKLVTRGDINAASSWRHKIAKISNGQLIQVGGFGAGLDNPLQILDFNSGGANLNNTKEPLFYRHSFGMDLKSSQSVAILGGLKTRASECGRHFDKDSSLVLYDLRIQEPVRYSCDPTAAHLYGCHIHFLNDNQFAFLAGISATSGLANSRIGIIDLRNPSISINGFIFEDSALSHPLILTNCSTVHLEESRQIVTTGGGGNYFTFGTHFNECHVVYSY